MEKEPELIRIDERFNIPVDDDTVMSLDKIREAQQAAIEGVSNLHDKIVIEVLEKYLGRKTKEEDYKRCASVICDGLPDNGYILEYDGVQLGAIIFETKITHKHNSVQADVTYSFDPTARIE